MNMNSTYLYVLQTNIGPTLYDFNASTFSISNKRVAFASACPSGSAPSYEDAIWSDVDPNIIFVHDQNLHIYAYNITTTTYTLVKDLSATLPAGSHTGQMNKNHTNDDLFSFTWKDNSWAVAGYVTWRSSTDVINYGSQTNLDECQPDRTGNYLILKLAASGSAVVQARILDLTSLIFTDITDGGPVSPTTPGLYWAPGHGDMGNGTILGHDDWNNRLVGRAANNPSAFYSVLDLNNDWSQDYHGSHLATDNNWITLSAYVSNTLPNSGLFKNEIFQVATNGSQSVRRLAHHHCDYLSDYAANGGGNAYWSSPKSCISRDGNWIVFTSNWGSTTRKDVFILKNPPLFTSLANIAETKKINVYPNPSEGEFTFSDLTPESKIEIKNLLGEEVYSSVVSDAIHIVDLKGFSNGIYFYTVSDQGGIVGQGKLVVQ